MPKKLTIHPHLSLDELGKRAKKSETGLERSHYQIIWLLAQGQSSRAVSEVTGFGVK